jgi:hypothetical protein
MTAEWGRLALAPLSVYSLRRQQMNWKDRVVSFGINFRDLRRGILTLACPAIILWLGIDAITRVSELYDGVCGFQGEGIDSRLAISLGYCNLGSAIPTLGLIIGMATLAVPAALAGLWYFIDDNR